MQHHVGTVCNRTQTIQEKDFPLKGAGRVSMDTDLSPDVQDGKRLGETDSIR